MRPSHLLPSRRIPARWLLCAVAVALLVPGSGGAGAAGRQTSIGTPTTYGLHRNVTLVGRTTLGDRGVNSPIAVAGPCVYVGDRYDHHGIAIVDVTNPAHPTQVGTIAPTRGSTQREIRADRGLGMLVVMTYSINGLGDTAGNYLKTYDIRDCKHPKLLATVDFGARSPHEFFLWKDAKHAGRTLAYITFTLFKPDLMVYDLTDLTAPKLVSVYDVGVDEASKTTDVVNSGSGYLHSISVSDDGTRAYMGNWDYGFYVADTSLLANPPVAALGLGLIHPVGAKPLDYGHNVHGAVKVPGRPYAVMVQEDYANAGHSCPFGWLRMADITNEATPVLRGEFKLPENDCARGKALNGTFTAHNQTVFPDLALVPWYSGGLRIVDIANPDVPSEAGAYVAPNLFTPDRRDTRLYFSGSQVDDWNGALWSYPVVQNGLIYVVDIDFGLEILRYTGAHAAEITKAAFVEGNSAPSRYTASAPTLKRPALAWLKVDALEKAGLHPVFRPALGKPIIRNGLGFFCM